MAVRMGSGPTSARIIVVGEAYGEQEERAGEGFVGASGQELNRMLQEANIMRSEVYVTNLVNARPPGNNIGAWIAAKKKDITPAHVPLHDKFVLPIIVEGYQSLLKEISLVKPNLIIALGNSPLWALTQKWGILRWRGSHLIADCGVKCIPTIHPAAVLRQWDLRVLAVNDLRRARRESATTEYIVPERRFIIKPSLEVTIATLAALKARMDSGEVLWIDFDLETRLGHIDCAGISWSRADALCIPFMTRGNKEGYWRLDEEAVVVWHLYKVLTHQNVKVRGQNLLYDCQYTARSWNFIPRVAQDCMISMHSTFVGLRKGLDFQASMFCDYFVQWKKDKGAWKELA